MKNNLSNKFFRKLYSVFVAAKRIINRNDKAFMLKALASLFIFVFVIAQSIKEFIFNKHLESSILFFFGVAYLTYSHFDEHSILAIAMLLCLYFSYDVISSAIKGEVRSRNDQIYKELLNNTQEQTKGLHLRKKMIRDLETFSSQIARISVSSSLPVRGSVAPVIEQFGATALLRKDLELVLSEELYFLDSVYNLKNQTFESISQDLDADLEFTNSKIEDVAATN